MMHKRIHTIGILIIIGSLFAVMGALAQSREVSPLPEIAPSSLCDIPSTSDGMLFRQTWPKATTLPDDRYAWQIANKKFFGGGTFSGEWLIENKELRQLNTDEGLTVAYETARDIGDGVIEGCMQFTSDITGVVPGGIAFRFHDVENSYGVGFAQLDGEVVFAVGKIVGGHPVALTSTLGYSPTLPNHVKIVLRGQNIKVYMNGKTTPVFDINDASFSSGKIGYVTYSSTARFGPLWADLDCSEFEDDFSPIGQAVHSVLTPTVFCSNQYQDLTMITQDVDSGRQAFEQMADAIADAHYEVDLATLNWFPSVLPGVKPERQAGNIILQGLKQDSGLKELYRRFVTDPQDYPQGMRVRILINVGTYVGTTYEDVLEALRSITDTITGTGIELNKVVTYGAYSTTWTVEVGQFRDRSETLHYNHAKLLVVDGRTVIAGGYNVHNYYTGIGGPMRDDMGLQVRGAIGFEAQTIFDSLWWGAKLHPFGARVPDPRSIFEVTNFYVIEHAPQIWSHTLTTDTAVFSLYRDYIYKGSDRAIVAALDATQQNVNLLQVTFSRDVFGFGGALPYEAPLLNAIRDRGVLVRLLTGNGDGLHRKYESNRRTVEAMNKALGSYAGLFQVRIYPDTHLIHTKALSLDGQFLIVGSQNLNNASWGSGGVDLAEYNLGLDGGTGGSQHPALQAFDTYFEQEWNSSNVVTPTWVTAGADLSAVVSAAQPYATLWLEDASYTLTTPLLLDKPLAVVGGGSVSTTLIAMGAMEGPLARITSGNVALVGLALLGGDSYGVEITAPAGEHLPAITVADTVLANNALGGVHVQARAGSALTYTLENNTVVGGPVGVRIDLPATSAVAGMVRNNIFSGQSDVPVVVDSDTDSGAQYRYNLFDNCARALGGVCPAQWYSATGTFTPTAAHNLINVDPRFVNAAGGDYTLQPNSPALDAGDPESTTDYDVDDDGDGLIRADIGALGFTQWPTDTGHVVLQSPDAGAEIGAHQIALQWRWLPPIDAADPLTPSLYHVQVAAEGQFQLPLIDVGVALTEIYQVPFLAEGVYYWRVGYTPTGTLIETWSTIRQLNTRQRQIYLPLVLR